MSQARNLKPVPWSKRSRVRDAVSNFTIEPCPPGALPGVKLITSRRFGDGRGTFSEVYKESAFDTAGMAFRPNQQNRSFSLSRFTVRGLHFQRPPHAQAKLVRCLTGGIFDVAVDLRHGSPTYGAWVGARLEPGGAQLFVPKGYAHGFCTLLPETTVEYLVDAEYAPQSDAGVAWDDPDIAVDWPAPHDQVVLSEKDAKQPTLADLGAVFLYEELEGEPA